MKPKYQLMRILLVYSISLLLLSCKSTITEKGILHELDLAFTGTPSPYYPEGGPKDIKYNFFLDLEHGYCETAGNRIHLYADRSKWAVVFEKSGYFNRGYRAEIELNFVGNCIHYPVDKYPERDYITNSASVELISGDEYERITNKEGTEMEQFELISPQAEYVMVRGRKVSIEHDPQKYEKLGIKLREFDNSRHLPGFGDLVRYLNETDPAIISATEVDIRKYIPADLPKIMTIQDFHYISHYQDSVLPSKQETYQLIAKVLASRDSTLWRPTLKANNHWSNWKSGNL